MDTVNRRKWARKKLNPMAVAAVWPHTVDAPPTGFWALRQFYFVDVCESSQAGLTIRSGSFFENKQRLHILVYHSAEKSWRGHIATVRWCTADNGRKDYFALGVSLETSHGGEETIPRQGKTKTSPWPSDYEFFRKVPFLRAIHRDAVCPLLNNITYRFKKSGERLITQGEIGSTSYIIQSGECRVLIEKQGLMHPVALLRKGDFVGEAALLTGEPRSAHVICESNTELWEISKELFEQLIENDPEVGTFLTEIMSQRFSSRKLTADRSIGKYTITDIIGRGGYAIVYQGYHMDLNRPAAIKMLKHDLALNIDFLSKFRDEAKMIASFNNDNIVKIYDIEECYRTVFIIMELLEGQILTDVISSMGRVQLRDALSIILDTCKGLQYAHEKGIVHQDIKPGNIFITSEGIAKILDFGLAAPCGSEHFMVGTPFYMSPEQVECLPVDERSDIYSLGLTAYEMVTGSRPFVDKDAHTTMNLHVERDIPDPGAQVPDLPAEFLQFIRRACARDPDERYPAISHALQDIEPLGVRLGVSRERAALEKQKMSTVFLFYRDHQQLELNRLVEEFTDRVKELGVTLKAVDFKEV